jgi:predicted adenylyl cyclase CyaB
LIELKAKAPDLKAVRDKLIQCEAKQIGVFHQVDTYYQVPKGRLKLREVEGEVKAKLVYYDRENSAEPKKSSVFILEISHIKAFKQILNKIMNTEAIVDKTREIYFYKGVQIHLDEVKGLGTFIEFERKTSASPKQQKKDKLLLEELREQLNISKRELERLSYSDLI